jgi:hypothetical protein
MRATSLSLHSLNGFFSQKSAAANAALTAIKAKLSQSKRFMVILALEGHIRPMYQKRGREGAARNARHRVH